MGKEDWGYDEADNPEQSKPAATQDIFALMDDFAKAVEIFSGFRQQFIDAGWKAEHAELMVLQFLKQTTETPKGT